MNHARRQVVSLIATAGVAVGCIAAPGSAQDGPEPRIGMTADEAAEALRAMTPTNAALVYYQHFVLASDALRESYVHFNADPDDDETYGRSLEEAEETLDGAQDTLDNLHWASTLDECDFGVQYQQGWAALMPHLGRMRSLARIFDADARRHADAGEHDKAAERLVTMYNMGRQLSGDHTLISALVSAAIVNFAHSLTHELIDNDLLTNEGRDLLIESLESFEAEDPFGIKRCVTMEGVISLGWLAMLPFEEGNVATRLDELLGAGAISPAKLRRLGGMSRAEFLAEAERMTEFYARTLELWDEPDAVDKIDALGAIVEAGGFGELAQVFAAAFGKSKQSDLRAQADLQTALDALRAYRAPEPDEQAEGATEATPGR